MNSDSRRAPEPASRVAGFVAATACLVVVLVYLRGALTLVAYPWDWSPDEGLQLDYARRLLHAPETLYPHTMVPFPAVYGPLLCLLLAPIVALLPEPLWAARLMAMGWTSVIAGCVYILARRGADRSLALVAVALALAPVSQTFWYMLVRVDGPMVALWLLAAVPLLPSRLEGGADRLSWRRIVLGSVLLLGAVLTKPTAIAHGAPLVLGWLLVDTRSALRLIAVLGGAGMAILGLLQIATGGGFLWVLGFWGGQPLDLRGMVTQLWGYFDGTWLLLLFAMVGLFLAVRSDPRRGTDGAWLMWLGGIVIVPAMAKFGAWANYLLPLLCATAVLGARLWNSTDPSGRSWPTLGALGGSAIALWLVCTQTFSVPRPGDRETAAACYGFIARAARESGRPILAVRPEYAYFVAGQSVEMEATSFQILVALHAPGIERILTRLETRSYGLVAITFFPGGTFRSALESNYMPIGACDMRLLHGENQVTFWVPRNSNRPLEFAPPAGTRCRSFLRRAY